MVCENCKTADAIKYSKYSSGRFCSKKCSQSFVAKCNKNKIANLKNKRKIPWNKGIKYDKKYCEKISQGLKQFFIENGGAVSKGETHSKAVGRGTKGKYKKENISNLYEISTRTKAKILKRLNVKCCICNWNEDIVDLHHIISRKKNGTNDHNNLTPLCPNHHRLADRGKLEVEKMIRLNIIIGDNWKELYYG